MMNEGWWYIGTLLLVVVWDLTNEVCGYIEGMYPQHYARRRRLVTKK
jgi:hypothetical protein